MRNSADDGNQAAFRDIAGDVVEKMRDRLAIWRGLSRRERRYFNIPAKERALRLLIKTVRSGGASNADIVEIREFIAESGHRFRDKADNESFKAFRERMDGRELYFCRNN